MSLSVDMFFSFRSPYSYLALSKTRKVVREFDVEVKLRPVYPLAIRVPNFFKNAHPKLPGYVMLDSLRVAESQGTPFRWPVPDPVVQDMDSLEVASVQPYITRLTRLGAAAQIEGASLIFADAVGSMLWDGSVDGWNAGNHLAKAAHKAGLDLVQMETAIDANPDLYDRLIQENENALADAGHWGVPTYVFEGEPFFGQDRIELLVWRMQSRGLRQRRDSYSCSRSHHRPDKSELA